MWMNIYQVLVSFYFLNPTILLGPAPKVNLILSPNIPVKKVKKTHERNRNGQHFIDVDGVDIEGTAKVRILLSTLDK